MINFNKLEPGKLYRVKNRYTLPYNVTSPIKGNLLTVFGESIQDTVEFFMRPTFQFRRYNRYFLDKRIVVNMGGKQVRTLDDQKELFDLNVKDNLPVRLCKNTGLVGEYNVIYELGRYMELLQTNERVANRSLNQKVEIKFDYIMNQLKSIDSKFPSQKKYLMIPVDKYVPFPRNVVMWKNRQYLENILIMFLRMIGTQYARFKTELKNWTFVFVNLNELFYLNCKDFDETTIETIKTLFRKTRSKAGYQDTTETDDELLSDDSEDNEDVLPEVNKAVSEKVEKKVDNIIDDTDLSSDIKSKLKTTVKSTIKKEVDTKSKDTPKDIKIEKVPVSETEEKETSMKKLATSKITKTEESDDSKDIPEVVKDSKNKLVTKSELEQASKDAIREELSKITSPSMSVQRLARVKKIQDDMKNLEIDDTPISKLAKQAESKIIDDHKIKADVINENLKNIKFDNFEKGYNEKLLNYDLTNILTSFSKMDRPLYLISLNKEDTSNTIDQLYTYNAVFEDEAGRRHNLTFDMPKFVNNKFIHINGSDKLFINQVLPLPVTKVSPDEVQVSSNYNKVFIRRFGKNISSKIAKFHKAVPDIDTRILKTTKGNNVSENAEYMTTIEYDELSSKYNTLELCNDGIIIYFNQSEIRNICDNEGFSFNNETELPFGIETLKNGEKKLLKLDINTDTVIGENNKSPIDFIVDSISKDIPSFKNDFTKLSSSKRMVYTRATIMAKKVPVVLLLGFLDGLEPLLNRVKVNYTFTETRPALKEDSVEKGVIKFKDGYLVYDFYPFSNSLLFNGLYDIPTEEYNFLDFSGKDIYYDIFQKMFGRRNIGVAFENFNQLFVDPITKEVLEDFHLPTNFIDLIIYANSLLENNTYDLDGDLKNYRMRSNELINAHLYKLLSKSYEQYRATADNKTPTKFSIKRDDLIKDIFNSQILEEYSTLNPIFEIDRMRSTSYKGPGGCNVDRAFSIAKRAYNDSMMGVFAQSSPISANIGISRILSLNPNITSLRGYIEPGSKSNIKDLDETKILSGAELLLPMTVTHDDAQRVSMASTQSRHTIATMDSDTPLFGYGMDKVLSKVISDRFAFKAKEDGEILEINENLGYMLLKYKSGKTDVVDLTNRQALNTGSGFYINNKLTPNFLDVGHKFKKDDVVARNDQFFKYDELTGDTVYKSGPLARIALIHGSAVFEDSTIITEELAERMSSYVTEKKDITIGKNSNIYHMAKVGDTVKTGDPLLIFDESYDDVYLNKVLEKMNTDEKDDLIEAARTPIKSKVNGKIIDIKIYHTVDKSELSESLQKIIASYERDIKKRLKRFTDMGVNTKDLVSLNETDSYVELNNGKIKGVKMGNNHVLIEFYIQTVDKFSVGDKLTYAVALKGVNQSLIPKGLEPYVGSDPNEKISGFLSVSGFYSRMTNSFALGMMLNTIMIGMEKKIKDILNK